MISERLFYFVHGIVTMFFLMAGVHRIGRKNASRLERLSGYVLLYWGILELKDLFFYSSLIFRDNYISNLLILIDMTAIPAGCYFVIELLSTGWFTVRRGLLLASPFYLTTLIYALTGAEWVVHTTFIFVWCYSVGFAIYMVSAVRRYNRLLEENLSNTEHVHVRWLKGVAVMLAVCLAVWTFSSYFSTWISDTIYQLVLMTMWLTALYYADRQETPQLPPPSTTQANATRQEGSIALSDTLQLKLRELMTKERIWMEPHLTLTDLAMRVGTNRTYLSNYLNKRLNTTFYDYINTHRLEAALVQLEDPNLTATMVEVAESCGFNSLSTFRRVFMRAKGCSFVEYRQRVLAEKGIS